MLTVPAHAQERVVIASIKPIHSLVASLAEGTDIHAELLVGGSASMHHMSVKPSQAALFGKAQAVVYVSEHLETFIEPFLRQHPKLKAIALENAAGITRYSARMPHHDEHDDEGGADLHLWTSPENARRMAEAIAAQLSAIYPDRKDAIETNLKQLDINLTALDARLESRMAPLAGKPFSVFHDATQYFERRYGLTNIGALTQHPDRGISAGQLTELRSRILAQHVACVFLEPGFDMRVAENMVRGTGAKSVVLDAEGLNIPAGTGMYSAMLEGIASAMETCLK